MTSTNCASAEWWYDRYGVKDILKAEGDKWYVKRKMAKDYCDSLVELAELFTNNFTDTPFELQRKIHNVCNNGVMKWLKICKLFDANPELKDILKPRDILEGREDDSIFREILQQELEKRIGLK